MMRSVCQVSVCVSLCVPTYLSFTGPYSESRCLRAEKRKAGAPTPSPLFLFLLYLTFSSLEMISFQVLGMFITQCLLPKTTILLYIFSFLFFCRNDRKRKKGIWIKSYNISGKCLGFVKMHSEIGKETRSLNGPVSCIFACHTTSTSLSNFVFLFFGNYFPPSSHLLAT